MPLKVADIMIVGRYLRAVEVDVTDGLVLIDGVDEGESDLGCLLWYIFNEQSPHIYSHT
jgi:hypothetical protein